MCDKIKLMASIPSGFSTAVKIFGQLFNVREITNQIDDELITANDIFTIYGNPGMR
jgi:hypothetical protein